MAPGRAGSSRRWSSTRPRSAAGASGIACGVVRNNYFQPAMSELMAACVEVWESDPEVLHYHGTGYIALGPARAGERPDRGATSASSASAIPPSCIVGDDAVDAHMRALYPDWRAPGPHACACTSRPAATPSTASRCSGWPTRRGRRARRSRSGVEVTGFDLDGSGAVTRSPDERRARSRSSRWSSPSARGSPRCGRCSASPIASTFASPTARSSQDQPMWTYWYLQEGEVDVRSRAAS